MYHGCDHLMTGLKTAFTRQPVQTTTTTLLQKTGLSHSNAVFADNLVGTLGSMGTVYWSRAGSSLITSSTTTRSLSNNRIAPIREGSIAKNNVAFEIYEKNSKHIFRNAPGHLPDSLVNRNLLIGVASDNKNLTGIDMYGSVWHSKILKNGKQIWTVSRNGQIRNGGVNSIPKKFNPKTGFSRGINE